MRRYDTQVAYARAMKERADRGPPFVDGEFAAAVVHELGLAMSEESQPLRRRQRIADIRNLVMEDSEAADLCQRLEGTPAVDHCHEQMADGEMSGAVVQPNARIPVAFGSDRRGTVNAHLPDHLLVVTSIPLMERVKTSNMLTVVDVLDIQRRDPDDRRMIA